MREKTKLVAGNGAWQCPRKGSSLEKTGVESWQKGEQSLPKELRLAKLGEETRLEERQ